MSRLAALRLSTTYPRDRSAPFAASTASTACNNRPPFRHRVRPKPRSRAFFREDEFAA
jgi:hypothetical protein